MKYLIVDDEPELLEIFEDWYRDDDKNHVEVVSNVKDAKGLLDTQEFDALLVDYQLSNEKGTDLVKYLRGVEKYKYFPIIIMSGIVNSEIAISYNNIVFLAKPFSKEFLEEETANLVNKLESRKKRPHLDPFVMQKFVETAGEVMSNFMKDSIEIGGPKQKVSRLPLTGDITAIMSIDTNKFRGNFLLTLDESAVLEVVSQMLFEEITEINEDVIDAVAELINMIVGNTKGKLSGYNFEMSAPMVITGKNYFVHSLDGSFCVSVPFKTTQGSFMVDIRLLPPGKMWQSKEN